MRFNPQQFGVCLLNAMHYSRTLSMSTIGENESPLLLKQMKDCTVDRMVMNRVHPTINALLARFLAESLS